MPGARGWGWFPLPPPPPQDALKRETAKTKTKTTKKKRSFKDFPLQRGEEREGGSDGARGHSGGVGDGFVFLEAGPLSCRVVHFKHRVHQHGGAAGAVRLRQHLRVLAQLDLDDVALLGARVLCGEHDRKQGAVTEAN